jgi:hypothetical protein
MLQVPKQGFRSRGSRFDGRLRVKFEVLMAGNMTIKVPSEFAPPARVGVDAVGVNSHD